ncbi:MAG: hypothetical protein K6E47_09545 [Lachnospiraceae bacterium]|nr:hypothetical protein [Lachnospiraceae bacterium]
MLITGSFTDIENNLNRYLRLFKESVLINNDYTAKLTISANGHSFIIVDRTTLKEVDDCLMLEDGRDTDLYVIDEDIYRKLKKGRYVAHRLGKKGCGNCGYKTVAENPKTATENTKTAISKVCVSTATEDKIDMTSVIDTASELPVFNDEYCIEDYVEGSNKLGKPCAFGIKYINNNVFMLYYRKSIYDKGEDTTFRHYLHKQPGTLVAYRYFKELKSLRYQFETLGKKLRHNGQNILSKVQVDYLVHYFTKCWI